MTREPKDEIVEVAVDPRVLFAAERTLLIPVSIAMVLVFRP